MPNIPDRIGNQNVIRVLSNIGASATRLVDLSDVDPSSLADGFVLEYNAQTSKFITADSFRFVKNINVTGVITTYNLDVIGVTTFRGDLYVGADLHVNENAYVDEYLYYTQHYYGPNGVAYFDNDGKLVGAASTEFPLDTSNFILTTEEPGGRIVWTASIDGGTY
jgi:hypothetical protein